MLTTYYVWENLCNLPKVLQLLGIFTDFDSLFLLLQNSFLALVSSISFELKEWGFWASKIELEAILDLFFFRLKIEGLPWKLPSELSSAKTVLSTAKTVEVNFGVEGRQFSWLVQGNLLKGIVIWLVAARSVVQSPVRALDSNFSNNFSLFQLLHLFNFYKYCWPYIGYHLEFFFGYFYIEGVPKLLSLE